MFTSFLVQVCLKNETFLKSYFTDGGLCCQLDTETTEGSQHEVTHYNIVTFFIRTGISQTQSTFFEEAHMVWTQDKKDYYFICVKH